MHPLGNPLGNLHNLSPRLISRRRMIEVGGLGLMGLSLPRLLRGETEAPPVEAKADACILIFLNGGPSHLDMWDMKPEAPDGIRGEFKPIASSLASVPVSEHLPRMAQHMHRTTLVRSMHHSVNNAHAAAVYTSMTGHDRGDVTIAIGNSSLDYPTIGSVLSLRRPPQQMMVPHVVLPYITKEGANGPPQPGFFGGFLGSSHDPMFILKDPNAADFAVPELTLVPDVSQQRLLGRKNLLSSVTRSLADAQVTPVVEAMDTFQQRALDLLTSERTQLAVKISEEPDTVREKYGRNIYGQSVLLARRMIEAGTRMVTISWAPDANATWDTHGSNFKTLSGTLLPQFDAAWSSLIEDLEQRGMLERTIVAVLGDFGRTPKINANNGGRDHWNYCYSVLLTGGGFAKGKVYGASDRIGAFPARDPLGPGDITATIYHLLGINPDQILYDNINRPHRLVSKGDPVRELMA